MVKGLWRKFDSDWGWNLSRLLAYTFLTQLFAVLGLLLIVLAFILRLFGGHAEQSDTAFLFGLLPNYITASAAA
ncbi:MAG TPA: hypothetical protein VKQ36_06425, partial [Ktedonobacterales bacterium]|nr:hypothetical protein [Ktedonobacterales bacterium]